MSGQKCVPRSRQTPGTLRGDESAFNTPRSWLQTRDPLSEGQRSACDVREGSSRHSGPCFDNWPPLSLGGRRPQGRSGHSGTPGANVRIYLGD